MPDESDALGALRAAHDAHVAAHGLACGSGRGSVWTTDPCIQVHRAFRRAFPLEGGRIRRALRPLDHEYQRHYRERHREDRRAYDLARQADPERRLQRIETMRRYNARNRERIAAYMRSRRAERTVEAA